MKGWYLLLLGMAMATTRTWGAAEPSPYRCSPSDVLEVTVAPQQST